MYDLYEGNEREQNIHEPNIHCYSPFFDRSDKCTPCENLSGMQPASFKQALSYVFTATFIVRPASSLTVVTIRIVARV